jgi:hypothetical protein
MRSIGGTGNGLSILFDRHSLVANVTSRSVVLEDVVAFIVHLAIFFSQEEVTLVVLNQKLLWLDLLLDKAKVILVSIELKF